MELKGTRQFLARMNRLTGKGFERDLLKALEAGAERIRDDARANLADTDEADDIARSLTIGTDPENLSVTIASSNPDAVDLEFGSSKVAERPFLAPAVRKNRAAIVRNVAATINNAIRRA